jgi:hypothetical protein
MGGNRPSNGAPATEKVDDDCNDRQDEQEMNQTPGSVECHQTEQPSDQQYDKQDKKHSHLVHEVSKGFDLTLT